jgi:hypothetical protein
LTKSYDIFEIFPDGTVSWRGTAFDQEDALSKLEALAALTKNEVRVMHLNSNEIVAKINAPD